MRAESISWEMLFAGIQSPFPQDVAGPWATGRSPPQRIRREAKPPKKPVEDFKLFFTKISCYTFFHQITI